MTWTNAQLQRIHNERLILQRYLPGFHIAGTGQNLQVTGVTRTNKGNRYQLCIPVPYNWPVAPCSLLVIAPSALYDYHNRNLANCGASHSMHLLSPHNGHLRICHHNPSRWSPRITFYKVLIKGAIWLRAYEQHRITGQPIDTYVGHQ